MNKDQFTGKWSQALAISSAGSGRNLNALVASSVGAPSRRDPDSIGAGLPLLQLKVAPYGTK